MISESPLTLFSDSPRLSLEPKAAAASPPPGELECRIEKTFERLDGIREAWDEAVIRLGGTIYMSYDWVRTWWDFYGAGHELRLFVFQSGDQVVGIVPLYIATLGVWPLRLKVARLVGANIPPKVFDPPIHEAWAATIFERILVQLFGKDACDLLSFGPVSTLSTSKEKLDRACEATEGLVVESGTYPEGVHTVFSLPASMEQYFDSLGKSERKKRMYELRLLQKEHQIKVEVLGDARGVEEEFVRFVEQHTAQWNAEGKPGHFGAWPRGKEYNHALIRAQGALGRVRFVRILANGQVVSNQYVFAFGDAWFWELPARAVGSEWTKFSLGPAGLIATVDAAIRERARRLEGGLGHYDYKMKLGASEQPVGRLRVVADRPAARTRLVLFNALRICLLYAYQKAWRRRLASLLPRALARPQWNFWLRLDF
jgi:hypothetical protein